MVLRPRFREMNAKIFKHEFIILGIIYPSDQKHVCAYVSVYFKALIILKENKLLRLFWGQSLQNYTD